MPEPFKIYRIVCKLNNRSLVSGSNKAVWYGGKHPRGMPLLWCDRGQWSDRGGTFWKTESSVKNHLFNLCHDFKNMSAPSPWPRWAGEQRYWTEIVEGSLDWSRLQHLSVEQFYVTDYSVTKLNAADFMGIPDQQAA